ncbi:MAG: hypothetical protein H6773_02045 [Pseudomonadales bacterium]|nr:hypothetical protein [Pseudomonadales bacterium]
MSEGRIFTGDAHIDGKKIQGKEVKPGEKVMYLDYKMMQTLNTGGRTYGYVGTEEAPGENYGKAKYVLQND